MLPYESRTSLYLQQCTSRLQQEPRHFKDAIEEADFCVPLHIRRLYIILADAICGIFCSKRKEFVFVIEADTMGSPHISGDRSIDVTSYRVAMSEQEIF